MANNNSRVDRYSVENALNYLAVAIDLQDLDYCTDDVDEIALSLVPYVAKMAELNPKEKACVEWRVQLGGMEMETEFRLCRLTETEYDVIKCWIEKHP